MLVGPVTGAKAGLARLTVDAALAAGAPNITSAISVPETEILIALLFILEPPDGSQDAAAKLPQLEKLARVFSRVLSMPVRPG
jgi:hypothetical protein